MEPVVILSVEAHPERETAMTSALSTAELRFPVAFAARLVNIGTESPLPDNDPFPVAIEDQQ